MTAATKRFPWLAVVGSLTLVLILAGGLFAVVQFNNDDEPKKSGQAPDGRSSSQELRDRLINEGRVELPTVPDAENAVPGHDYTKPLVTNVDADLTLAANYEAEAVDPWQGAPGKIEVYSDAELTRPVPITIVPDLTSSKDDPRLAIRPTKLRRAHIVREGDQVSGTSVDLGSYWNINPQAYVVQHLTPEGTQRPRPLVTKVSFAAEAPAPEEIYSTLTSTGDAQLEWSPVAVATEYAVVLQKRRGTSSDDTVQVVGRTTENNWTSAETERCHRATCEQNTVLKLTTADASLMASVPTLTNENVEARLGIVAVVDGQPSVMAAIDFEGLDALPVRSDLKWDEGADLARRGLEALPSRFLFVSIDGSTRATGASIEREEVTRAGANWVVPLRGVGTRLVSPVRVPVAAIKNLDAAVAEFNARAQREHPHSGLLNSNIVIDVDHPKKPAPELPAPDYPVFGSNELTKFIASQLIAGAEAIDVSEYVDRAGLPDVSDALQEARYQNPYALAYFDQFTIGGDVIYVEYAYPQTERESRQKAIADAADRVVTEQLKAQMSDAEKVSAINRYLVDNAEYDKAAIAGTPGKYVSDIPAKFRYAWETDGILVSGTGVCMSYSYAFQALAEEAGLESVVVTGDLADGGGHAWNKVKVGGSWQAVDVTWNDPRGGWSATTGERYLMISDDQFTGSALRTEDDAWIVDGRAPQYATR